MLLLDTYVVRGLPAFPQLAFQTMQELSDRRLTLLVNTADISLE